MANDNRKLLVITGITGNQGGSVARTFLTDPELRAKYRLRGVSRQSFPNGAPDGLAGVEMVKADLHDPASLFKAFEGAGVIFSVTDFWKPYLDKNNQAKAQAEDKHIGQLSYELEYEQGRNIAGAAAQTPGLERFIVSMLCSTKKASNGRYDKIYHFDSKADMITCIKESHPDLASKMSELNMGVFFQSWKMLPHVMVPQKMDDGVYVLRMPCDPDKPVPFVDPNNDTGLFVKALLEMKPGVQLYGETSLTSWNDWLAMWGRSVGKKVRMEQVRVEDWEKEISRTFPHGLGTEIAEMFEFVGLYGYDGGDMACKRKDQLNIDIPGLSNLEEYMKNEDWSMGGV